MSAVVAVAYYVGFLLLVITAITSARAAWRYRDRHHFDILIAVASLVAMPLLRRPAGGVVLTALGLGVFLAQPYFLLRLVQHFRDVSTTLRAVALVVPVLGTVAALMWPPGPRLPAPANSVTALYLTAFLGYCAFVIGRESNRKSGVTARRLFFASSGAAIFALTAALALFSIWIVNLGTFGGNLSQLLHAVVLICFFFAFNTPRRLRSNWQRGEQAKYLSRVADRDPEERGRRAADDLSFAGAGAVGNAVTIVALGDTPDADQFTVRSSSDRAFNGLMIRPGDGVIGRVCRTRAPVADAVAACEPDIAGKARQYGVRVLAAPIVADTNFWGVVLVVQRRGSLFPDDDLELLAQLARYAAAGLDHAHLIAEIRARERRAADRRLREIETRMSLMLDSIKDYAMFVMDEHGRIVTWHIGAEHVFGHSSREIADAAAAPLFAMTDADFAALLSEARRAGHADREGPCRRRDGTRFVGATTVRPLADDDERLGGFVAVTRDVTEQRNLEDRLRQSQKMEAVGQLAGGIAHDFNNLLTAVLGYADMLAQDFADDPEHASQIHEIQRAGEVAAGLTRQLLAFSRRQVVQPVVTDLTALVEDLVPMLRRVLGQKIEIEAAAAPNLAPILADRHQMEQILLNLSVNARDAMPRGGRLTIRTANVLSDESAFVSDDLPGPSVLLEVADTGIGMDPTVLPRIFEPFYTTKALGRGTGLGLATVYGIVQQMGGVIRVTSQPNQGATFKLYFPHVQLRDAERGARASASGAEGSETVLLVEDQPAVRTFVTQTLERHGYRVLAAEDQSDALAVVQSTREPIDLVITDVLMPGGTGPELVRALDQIRPGLPALFMSGYADAIVSDRESRSTTRDFLQKPFSAADLLSRIRDILGRR